MKNTSDLNLGEARAQGPATSDMLKSDAIPPPEALLEQNYDFLGDEDIAVDRYISRDFFHRTRESRVDHQVIHCLPLPFRIS